MMIDVTTIVSRMIEYFGTDVKRINHALKVYSFCKCIGESEGLNIKEQYILEASAVLHDIGIKISEKKYNSSAGKYQEKEGPAVALEILQGMDISNDALERICFLIGNHHSYGKMDGKDFQILIEADFLVNAYESKINVKGIEEAKNKIFKTQCGTKLLNMMYGI